MRIKDFALSLRSQSTTPQMAYNPLAEKDALQETLLQHVHFEVSSGTAVLIFDCKGALQVVEGNMMVISVFNVIGLKTKLPNLKGWNSWTVIDSTVLTRHNYWELTLLDFTNKSFEVKGSGAQCWVGDVSGMDDAPPDFSDDTDETIRSGLANLDSEFKQIYSISINR